MQLGEVAERKAVAPFGLGRLVGVEAQVPSAIRFPTLFVENGLLSAATAGSRLSAATAGSRDLFALDADQLAGVTKRLVK